MRDDNYHQEWSGDTKQQATDHAFYNTVMYLQAVLEKKCRLAAHLMILRIFGQTQKKVWAMR